MIKVKMPFIDKYNKSKSYSAGEILDWTDENRISDCVARGLIEVIPEAEEPEAEEEQKPKRKTTKKAKQQ